MASVFDTANNKPLYDIGMEPGRHEDPIPSSVLLARALPVCGGGDYKTKEVKASWLSPIKPRRGSRESSDSSR